MIGKYEKNGRNENHEEAAAIQRALTFSFVEPRWGSFISLFADPGWRCADPGLCYLTPSG
jgi:hypothetical protein